MFKFLKNLFKKEEIIEEVSLELKSLKSLFNSDKENSIKIIKGEIEVLNNNIKEEIFNGKKHIELLKNGTLRNPNIPAKEKDFMEGNRDSYVKKSLQLFDGVNIPSDLSEIQKNFMVFVNEVNEFGKATHRSYKILGHFFAEEASKIAKSIKKLEDNYKKIVEVLNNNNYSVLVKTSKDIEGLFGKIEAKKTINEDIVVKEKEYSIVSKELEQLNDELKKFKKSSEYADLIDLKGNLEVLKEKLRNEESEIIHPFSVIDQALKKYSRMALDDNALCLDYNSDPIKALVSDKELRILKILESLKYNVSEDKITLKDKKKEKTISSIESMTKDFFEGYLEKRSLTDKEINNLNNLIINNNILDKISKTEENINSKKIERDNKKRSLDEIKSKNDNLDIEKIKKDIKDNYLVLFNKKIIF